MEFIKLLNLANILLVVSIIYKLYPPKVINDLYGFRTARSKSSQETWDVSNKMSADFLLKLSIVSVLLYNPAIMINPSKITILTGLILIVVVLIIGHIFIERELRRLFDEKGNRIE